MVFAALPIIRVGYGTARREKPRPVIQNCLPTPNERSHLAAQ
jgi:hypothetical protein